MAIEPNADPELIRELDAAIQGRLKAAFESKKIDAEDALYLLIARLPSWSAEIELLPEWGRRKFVLDMVNAAFDPVDRTARERTGGSPDRYSLS